jgi:ankyrin repeat protein
MADSGFPWAVKTGDMKGVQVAVDEGEDVNQVSNDTNKRTPMHWAADYNQVEVGLVLCTSVDLQDCGCVCVCVCVCVRS